jgi:hypothetical protein
MSLLKTIDGINASNYVNLLKTADTVIESPPTGERKAFSFEQPFAMIWLRRWNFCGPRCCKMQNICAPIACDRPSATFWTAELTRLTFQFSCLWENTHQLYPSGASGGKEIEHSLHDEDRDGSPIASSEEINITCDMCAPGLIVDSQIAGNKSELSFTDVIMNCDVVTR